MSSSPRSGHRFRAAAGILLVVGLAPALAIASPGSATAARASVQPQFRDQGSALTLAVPAPLPLVEGTRRPKGAKTWPELGGNGQFTLDQVRPIELEDEDTD